MPYDLVLRGGHVIDPANGRDSVMDVAVSGDRIIRVAPRIDDPAVKTLNVDGLYVTPGLIDIHVHVFPFRGPDGPTWQSSIVPDAHSFRTGVTTFVDAGTAGADDFPRFKQLWIDRSATRVLAWLNIASKVRASCSASSPCAQDASSGIRLVWACRTGRMRPRRTGTSRPCRAEPAVSEVAQTRHGEEGALT